MRGRLPVPYFAAGAARETTKKTGDRYGPLLRTHCKKCARSRCVSADLRNHQELKGIRAGRPLRERSVITSRAVGVWRLFDRNLPKSPVLATNLDPSVAAGDVASTLVGMEPVSVTTAEVVPNVVEGASAGDLASTVRDSSELS